MRKLVLTWLLITSSTTLAGAAAASEIPPQRTNMVGVTALRELAGRDIAQNCKRISYSCTKDEECCGKSCGTAVGARGKVCLTD